MGLWKYILFRFTTLNWTVDAKTKHIDHYFGAGSGHDLLHPRFDDLWQLNILKPHKQNKGQNRTKIYFLASPFPVNPFITLKIDSRK